MNNLLALDQASKISGFAIFINQELKNYGTFVFTDTNIDKRLVKIRQQILDIIKQYNINYVVMEDIQEQNNNIKTYKVLAEVYGVIAEVLQENAIPHDSMLAVSWRSILGIKGRARTEQKKNTQTYVKNTYGLDVSEDTADAIAIGTAFLKHNTTAPGAWD